MQNLKRFTEGKARKFTVNFAIFGYADVINIRKNLRFYVSARRLLQLASSDLDGAIFADNSSMRLAHVMSATRIVSSKSGLRHLYDMCTQHEKCHRILKHVLKPYDSRSHNRNVRMTSYIRSLLDASSARYKSRIRQP